MMNPGIKARWVEALRSGEYKQGAGCLRTTDDCFCCLGVLADLYVKEKGVEWVAPQGGQPSSYSIHMQGGVLPVEVAEWADLRDKAGVIDICPCVEVTLPGYTQPTYECLTGLNDNGVPFSEIANKIEASL